MQTIIKTAPTSNFTIIANDLISSDIPPTPKSILLYLLSKPVNWKMRRTDLRKHLGLSAHAIQKGLKWLQQAGYAYFTRNCGFTKWFFYDKPQTNKKPETAASLENTESFAIQYINSQQGLQITETETKKETTTPTPETETENLVVVSSNDLIYPVQLNTTQKKAARAVIKKVKQPELQQPVLFALAYAITSGTVKSPVAYLNGLVSRANVGTFEPIQATTASKQGGKPLIPIWQGFKASTPSKPEVATGFIQAMKAAARGVKC